MSFWADAFKWGWADANLLRMVVITEDMPFGEITKDEFKQITGEDFDLQEPEQETETENATPEKK